MLAIALVPCSAIVATGISVVAVLAGQARDSLRVTDFGTSQMGLVTETVTALRD
ncbi:hypothetical protein [Nocardia vaccinii]|uniref:hypothetical protein n=1 Tax=Nocardia vaccinii TaxID=1822 RepID=UPI000B113947|nr:hypothetical protein [Nocardia vaccinii]